MSQESFEDFQYYIQWYKKQGGSNASNPFESIILLSIEIIKNNPYIARASFEVTELREYVLKKYPFVISYYIKNENTISITSLLHQRRKR